MTDRPSERRTPGRAVDATAAADFDKEILSALPEPTRPAAAASYFAEDTFDALDVFRGLLLEHSRFETLLQGLCDQVVAAVPGADMAGVTLLHHNSENPATAACSDARVVDIDADQYNADEGPCLEASRTNRIVCVRVDEVAARWPTFASRVADIGVKSYLSAPLAVDSGHAGSLNIYSFDGSGFNDIDEVLVKMFVTSVEAAVWNSRHATEARNEVAGLRLAMKTRATIEQAKGILAVVRGFSPDAAFAALVEQSQRENTRVAVLAQRIVTAVAGRRRFGEPSKVRPTKSNDRRPTG
ncbi:GAF and ANTAR domain-containing protein [Rhodococcus sp. IEGM 1381]|uniref:GAF and ANTAR domain-containing protein n=1 Tax=Rhodococcus sp. IEGM 1381 TaxID=3047085 RepID=UPI0024B7845C|nr:GAF and ANTAR domain-containing protein [Rhodococcus sp. IEGM 1381]MDI9894153.1 GAF and ANTAR domain-containing protein [Rhodococcus sp. IEGM 1381]